MGAGGAALGQLLRRYSSNNRARILSDLISLTLLAAPHQNIFDGEKIYQFSEDRGLFLTVFHAKGQHRLPGSTTKHGHGPARARCTAPGRGLQQRLRAQTGHSRGLA